MGRTAGLKKTQIIYTTYLDGVESYTDRFSDVKTLGEYFHEHKRKGEVVGYVVVKNRTPRFNDSVLSGKLTIEWWDANGYASEDFDHVNKMVEFLQQETMIALKLNYEPKKKKKR